MDTALKKFVVEKVGQSTQKKLNGRYVDIKMLEPVILDLPQRFRVEKMGRSFEKRNIFGITFGTGKTKILVWTQMHGNESTGTKAVFDVIQLLANNFEDEHIKKLLVNCTIKIIPMLNPDGAEVYSRVNAQGIDLNRDVIDQKAPETRLLLDILHDYKPDYCFNLHDQRTIFSVTKANLPATLSFLAPSIDQERTVTEDRKRTMAVIAAMFSNLEPLLPNGIGRYSDEFYPTATGDNFEKMGYRTILIEAGHFPGDYQREKTRKYNAMALLFGWFYISGQLGTVDYRGYFTIPANDKNYLDAVLRNCEFDDKKGVFDVGILFQEQLVDGRIRFTPKIDRSASSIQSNADIIINMKNKKFRDIVHLEELIPKILIKN